MGHKRNEPLVWRRRWTGYDYGVLTTMVIALIFLAYKVVTADGELANSLAFALELGRPDTAADKAD